MEKQLRHYRELFQDSHFLLTAVNPNPNKFMFLLKSLPRAMIPEQSRGKSAVDEHVSQSAHGFFCCGQDDRPRPRSVNRVTHRLPLTSRLEAPQWRQIQAVE